MGKDNFWQQICFFTLFVFAFTFTIRAQYKIEVLDSNAFQLGEGVVLHKTSFRGLSVVNDQTIWVSGSRGTIARSVDGGQTFVYKQLKGYEKSDFRDIEAFDSKRAIVMSSGTPALILKTSDGGETWKEVFRKNDSAYFLDAMDFWDEKRGMLVGDPIHNHFVLLQTTDGGETWQELDTSQTPIAMEGEAVFAASGTSLRCWGKNEYGIVTGGTKARFIRHLVKWESLNLPLPQGDNGQGAFSFVKLNKDNYFIVGGDYKCDTCASNPTSCVTIKGYGDLYKDSIIVRTQYGNQDYKSSIELISKTQYVAVGTQGVYMNKTKCNRDWYFWVNAKISSEPFHVVRKAKKGKSVFLAGPKGKIGKLVY
ncbi:MAG: YCF48-related protein [Bacteroidia bacterium]|jgi:hypothetical protein|nr:YCF48-related protein [Bacteroidia bacterium]